MTGMLVTEEKGISLKHGERAREPVSVWLSDFICYIHVQSTKRVLISKNQLCKNFGFNSQWVNLVKKTLVSIVSKQTCKKVGFNNQ